MAVLLVLLAWLVKCRGELFDEIQAFEPECLVEGAFSCLGGGCVPQENYCDGKRDCKDGSDENFCANLAPDALFCNETHQFLCSDGRRCVPSAWVCNAEPDCADGSDEANCTAPVENVNSTCKGFLCDGGKRCISSYWMCDGHYDCDDKTDEDIKITCHHALRTKQYISKESCEFRSSNYNCLDGSYCVGGAHMCDGLQDCRDGSDEGKHCEHWHTMCTNFSCPQGSFCKPQRSEVTCVCDSYKLYNKTTKRCEEIDNCMADRPLCSHKCKKNNEVYSCSCDEGYIPDHFDYLCFAPDPEALLFFSTKNDIRYVKVKSKEQVVVATGIKRAHGVSYDGNYLYWVETADGHEAIMRAQLHNIAETKQVVAALGVEDPGDIAVDHLGDNIYFSDTERGIISVCRSDGSLCTTLHADTRNPRFVTLDPKEGKMYWADWHDRAVVMTARMDGSGSSVLVDHLSSFATGLALDAPNGRLYFVDRTIRVVKLENKAVYSFFEEPFHHPYSLAVFESNVFWSDWTTNTVQTADKIHGATAKRNILLALDVPVFDMHIYHPVLMKYDKNPCDHQHCAICLLTSNETHVCACPDDMEMMGDHCQTSAEHRSQFVVVGGGARAARVRRAAVGNPEAHAAHLDVGRLQAMAYDSRRDTLYIYDSQHKSINYINMSDFTLGITHILLYKGLENVVDMDYDYMSDTLYVLDAGRRLIEVVSLSSKHNAIIYHFPREEIPISFCLLPDYGKMLVAVLESDDNNEIHIDSIGLDGENREHVLQNNIVGPNVRIRYSPEMNVVYMSDEGSGVIDVMHPEGTGRENFRDVITTVASLAVTDAQLFWTDRRSARLYWADAHEASRRVRRIELTIFPNDTTLHVLATSPPPRTQPVCAQGACEHVCVQTRGTTEHGKSNFTCICSPGYRLVGGTCLEIIQCHHDEVYCHRSNECFREAKKCDGFKDCKYGEDEEGCVDHVTQAPSLCRPDQTNCHGVCIPKNVVCKGNTTVAVTCSSSEFRCGAGALCVARSLACDGRADCPDASDEGPAACDAAACFDTEFMCGSGNCIPITWHCDGGEDCADGSDEVNCENMQCPEHKFQCRNNSCIDLSKRCDGKFDCDEQDDEDGCDTSEFVEISENTLTCMPWEYSCEYNRSICLPMTARCNGKVECPGSTDEDGCDMHCAQYNSVYSCKQENLCLSKNLFCDGRKHCSDGSDETKEACEKVNKTFPVQSPSFTNCSKGYRCDSGQCIEWADVCNDVFDCLDHSDENGLCKKPCSPDACAHGCRASPRGPQCACPHGYAARAGACADVDECAARACSHVCRNLPGSFVCACHAGYALRSDRRSCKALRGRLTVLYARSNLVWSMTSHIPSIRYQDGNDKDISDIGVDVRRGKLYIASKSGKLMEVDQTRKETPVDVITNVGIPSKVAVEWVSGGVYFSERARVRVCRFRRRRCATLLRLPASAQVTALIVDPANYKLFYCVSTGSETVVRSASLSGRRVSDLGSVSSCSGLAADSFSMVLYVATASTIMEMDYDGNVMKTIITDITQAPHSLALFEDHLYLTSGSNLTRCLLFGSRTCSTYSLLPNATTFIIEHESVQRNDVYNDCDEMTCSNVCVLDPTGPQCVCHDGSLAGDGNCPPVTNNELAHFSGSSVQQAEGRALPLLLVGFVLVLFALYAGLVAHRVVKRKNAADYMQVRYQNNPDGMSQPTNPIIDMPEAQYLMNGMGHEFVNPLQFVRNIWQESFYKKSKPIGTAGIVFETTQDLSDTESDLDVRENRRMIKN